jgi:hypothetical protein
MDRKIGYYPGNLFSNENPPGLAEKADNLKFYGEVLDSFHDPSATKTDMGSGGFPHQRFGRAAYMENLFWTFYYGPVGWIVAPYRPNSVWATDSSKYDVEGHFDNTTTWNSHFWWGGPGQG